MTDKPTAKAIEPFAYAYLYDNGMGGTTIRFNNGQEVNGSRPYKAVAVYDVDAPALLDMVKRLIKAQQCPHCHNQGWYAVPDRHTGEPIQEQCEFCYTTPDSIFNMTDTARALVKRIEGEA